MNIFFPNLMTPQNIQIIISNLKMTKMECDAVKSEQIKTFMI